MGLAQVLCQSPQVLLLDEPFSALDAPVRLELRRELRRVQRETGLATVLVTHDPEEAAFLSDELMVIARGEVLQSGTSRSVFSRPVSPEVARLVGVDNVHVGSVVSSTALAVGDARVTISSTTLALGTSRALERATGATWSVTALTSPLTAGRLRGSGDRDCRHRTRLRTLRRVRRRSGDASVAPRARLRSLPGNAVGSPFAPRRCRSGQRRWSD